jgi:DNA-binding MarR family transcriptional regulator
MSALVVTSSQSPVLARLMTLSSTAIKCLVAIASAPTRDVLMRDIALSANVNTDSVTDAVRQLVQQGFVLAESHTSMRAPHGTGRVDRFSNVRVTALAVEAFEELRNCAADQLRQN